MKLLRCSSLVTLAIVIKILTNTNEAVSKTIKIRNGKQINMNIGKILVIKAKRRNTTRIRIKKCCGYSKCGISTSDLLTDATTKIYSSNLNNGPTDAAINTAKIKPGTNQKSTVDEPSQTVIQDQPNTISDLPDSLSSLDQLPNDITSEKSSASNVEIVGSTSQNAPVEPSTQNSVPIQSPTSNTLNPESPAASSDATLAGPIASIAGNQPTTVTISNTAQHTSTPTPSQIISGTTARSNILTTNTAFSPTQSIALTTTSIKGAATTAASSQLSTTTNAKSVSTSSGVATTTNSQTQNVLSTTKGPSTTAAVATAGASSTAAATTTASTQTTKAVPFPDCPAVACQQEPAKVSESQLWKPSTNGDFYSGCSKQYFISKAAKKRDDAMIECCKYGLQLLSIDSFDEIACIIDFNSAEAKESGQFWTSGSNLGDLTQNTPGWCTTKTFLPSTSVWFKGQPNNPSTERCISFQMSNTAVGTDYGCHDNTCTNLYRFICEGDVSVCNVTCPRNCPSKLDKKLFNSKNQLMDSNSYGRWITGCGSTYLFSNTRKFGWTGSYDFCCSMGMSMVKFETHEEFKCLFDLNKNEVSLKFNGDFWTSASQLDCAYKFEWCDSGVRLYRNDTRWWPGAGGQPNNLGGAQACTFLHFQPGVLPTDGYLNDWDCAALYDFICEMPAITNPTTVTCNDVLPCSTDATYAQQLQTMTSKTGKFFEACSRTYFFSTNTLTYDAAITECCKYGLRLVSFETLAEFQCVLDLNNANMKYAATFWTSGTNDGIGMENSWGWCPSGKLLESGFSWKTGEPNNIYTENCLALSTAIGDYSLSKIASTNCKLAYRYICEAA